MLTQALVLLSDDDTDAPALPGLCTVSKDDPGDHGAYALGRLAAARGALWVDRPYVTGNPSVDWLAAKVERNHEAGALTQLGNESNDRIVERFVGEPEDLFSLHDAVLARLTLDEQASVLAMPPSPGIEGWQRWINRDASKHAVHCYGPRTLMQSIVQWYLDNTTADLYVTEVNPGAGNVFDLDAWAESDLRPFLDWAATQPRVKMVAYFAWRWDLSPALPSSVDAVGTHIETVLRAWTPPAIHVAPDAVTLSTSPTPVSTPAPKTPVSTPPGGSIVPDVVLSVPMRVSMASVENYQPGPRARTIGVVVHTTRGGGRPENEFSSTIAWFTNPDAQVSAHLVVGHTPFDEVARCVHDDDLAWHCREVNQTHLGIEICQATPTDPITDFQYKAAAEACRLWAAKYHFPLKRVMSQNTPGLIGHEDAEAGKRDGKTDPGPIFDWTRFLKLVGGTTVPPTPTTPADAAALVDATYAAGQALQDLGAKWTLAGHPQMAEYVRNAGESVKRVAVIAKGVEK